MISDNIITVNWELKLWNKLEESLMNKASDQYLIGDKFDQFPHFDWFVDEFRNQNVLAQWMISDFIPTTNQINAGLIQTWPIRSLMPAQLMKPGINSNKWN